MKWWIEAIIKAMPGGLANTFPLILLFLDRPFGVAKKLTKPIDAGIKLRDGNRLFGDGKTWLGFFAFPLAGILVALALSWTGIHTWLTGLVMPIH